MGKLIDDGDTVAGCPFCGVKLRHTESDALSFTPPRVYHEYRHPMSNCILSNYMQTFDDRPEPRLAFIARWNRRDQPDAGKSCS